MGRRASSDREERPVEAALAFAASIVESSDDAIVGKTLDGIITSWNAGAERLYGYPAAEVVGKSIALLVPADRPDELPGIVERLRRGGRVEPPQNQRGGKGGRRVPASPSTCPLQGRG